MIPSKTIIYYSRRKSFFAFLAATLLLLLLVFIILHDFKSVSFVTIVLCSIFSICLVCQSFISFKKLINNTPQIIISNNGIETVSSKFYKWSEIKNEKIFWRKDECGYNRTPNIYLIYKHPRGKVKLRINDYSIEYNNLEQLLKMYRKKNLENV